MYQDLTELEKFEMLHDQQVHFFGQCARAADPDDECDWIQYEVRVEDIIKKYMNGSFTSPDRLEMAEHYFLWLVGHVMEAVCIKLGEKDQLRRFWSHYGFTPRDRQQKVDEINWIVTCNKDCKALNEGALRRQLQYEKENPKGTSIDQINLNVLRSPQFVVE